MHARSGGLAFASLDFLAPPARDDWGIATIVT
jgi:hypothetical protein